MGKRNSSWRQYSVLAAACVVFGVAGRSNAQVTFTPPAGAPQGGAGTLGIQEVYNGGIAGGGLGDQGQARATINSPLPGAQIFNYTAPVLNIFNSDQHGHFLNDSDFKAQTLAVPALGAGGVDNIALVVQGRVHIPSTGVYTFGVNSDDGFTLAFNNGATPFSNAVNSNTDTYNGNANGALTFFGGRGASDSFGQVTLAAGDHPFVLTYHEGGGGSSVELMAAKGAHSSFNSFFHLVGGSDAPAAPVTRFTGTTSGFSVTSIHGNNANSLTDAVTDLTAFQAGGQAAIPARGGGTPVATTISSPTVNFVDPQGANNGGHFPVQTYPGDNGAIDDNNFSTGATGTLTIPAGRGGHYTFLAYTDDSSLTRLLFTTGPNAGKGVPLLTAIGGTAGGTDSDGDGIKDAFTNDGGCCSDILGTYQLDPGNYVLQTISNEQGGGAGHFLYGAFGDQTAFGPAFQLVGQNIDDSLSDPGPLALVAAPEPGSIALFGLAGIAALARRRRA